MMFAVNFGIIHMFISMFISRTPLSQCVEEVDVHEELPHEEHPHEEHELGAEFSLICQEIGSP